jgi:hypothetical protein
MVIDHTKRVGGGNPSQVSQSDDFSSLQTRNSAMVKTFKDLDGGNIGIAPMEIDPTDPESNPEKFFKSQ